MDRAGSGSGELSDSTVPAKRKSPGTGPPADGAAAAAAAAGAAVFRGQASLHQHPQQLHRSSCGLGCSPAMSSPAIGGWAGLHCGDVERDDEGGLDSAESARCGKALRVCTHDSGPCLPAPAAGSQEAGEQGHAAASRPVSCHNGSPGSGGLVACSLPPGMYRSYHSGCCSRLNSTTSLSELEAAAAAVALTDLDCDASPCHSARSAAEPASPAAVQAALACSCMAAPGSTAAAAYQQAAGEVTASGLAAAAASRPQQGSWPPPAACRCSCEAAGLWEQQQAGEEESQWHDIPDDILKRVLDRLPPSTLRVLRLVCRGWEAAASRLLTHLRPEAILGKHLSGRFPALHSLDLSNAMMGVDLSSPRMLRLQSLLQDDHLAELAGLTRLEQLSLRGCTQISGIGLAQLGRLPCLSMLNLSSCSGLRDECLAALAAAAPQLATLNLQGCPRLGDDGIAHLAAMPCLRHVLLPSGVSDACMLVLTEMPALERVALRGCSRVTTAGIYLLLQRPGLKRVVISKCPNITLESLCGGGARELGGAQLVAADVAGIAQAAAAAAAGAPAVVAAAMAAAAVPPGMAGQDMQLLVGDA